MVEQLRSFASGSHARCREVGTEGRLGVQAVVPESLAWKDLTDSVNAMATNLTAQIPQHRGSHRRIARGDLNHLGLTDVKGENSGAEKHHQHDGRSIKLVRR